MKLQTNSQFWIQDSNGLIYSDSIGLDPRTDLEEAMRRLREWQKSFPERCARLIVRTDTVIMHY